MIDGKKMSRIMKEKGISSEKLIEKLSSEYGINLSLSSIKKYRIGKTNIPIKTISAIANILDCSEIDFFYNSEDKKEYIIKNELKKNANKYLKYFSNNFQTRIYYDDTDAGGIVYHTNYLKYCERARSELFFSRGLMPFEGENSGFVVKKIEADFLGSAKLGDILEVKTNILKLKRASIILIQKIFKEEKEIFSANITLAFIRNSKPSKIPEKFLEIFETIKNKEEI